MLRVGKPGWDYLEATIRDCVQLDAKANGPGKVRIQFWLARDWRDFIPSAETLLRLSSVFPNVDFSENITVEVGCLSSIPNRVFWCNSFCCDKYGPHWRYAHAENNEHLIRCGRTWRNAQTVYFPHVDDRLGSYQLTLEWGNDPKSMLNMNEHAKHDAMFVERVLPRIMCILPHVRHLTIRINRPISFKLFQKMINLIELNISMPEEQPLELDESGQLARFDNLQRLCIYSPYNIPICVGRCDEYYN